ncbi:unnamed protein product [Rotaria sp. Silwood1]|nr:unnamed protein product [Rotaria sp. Silwood1]CAF5135704.1 unnamed protein product [Rotaria sp. Silwood1]
MYTFRFENTNKYIHLTQQQLDHLPYLLNLVNSTNNEYILNSSIDYNSFMIILDFINSKISYDIFNKLEEHENILNLLDLFDYIGVNLFSIPTFKDEYLLRSKHDNNQKFIQYDRGNLLEMRNKAAEFIIALNKNEYKLDDIQTLNNIFSLLMVIFHTSKVYSAKFRHHTLTIVNKCCFSLFSNEQQSQLPTIQQITENKNIDSLLYLSDDNLCLSEFDSNAFAWKTIQISTEENNLHSINSTVQNVNQLLLPSVIHLNYLLQLFNISTLEKDDNKQKHQKKYVQEKYYHIVPKNSNIDKFNKFYCTKC